MARKKTSTIPLKKTIGKYDPAKHAQYVEEFAHMPLVTADEYVEVDPNYIRCISHPTKKMIDRVIYKAPKLFHLVAKHADNAQALEAVKAVPVNVCFVNKPSKKVIDIACKKADDWFTSAPPKTYSAELQLAMVKANPQSIKWILAPEKAALELAAKLDPSLEWVRKLYL